MVRRWKIQGIKVHVTAGCNYIPADLAILHVDISEVGEEYLELAQRYPSALNATVKDILKSSISDHLVKRTDRYPGPVIVKTNANYGGVNELLVATGSGHAEWPDENMERPWRKREILDSLNYPVFDKASEVPLGVWKNDKLIVEKFLPERYENGDYRCRFYFFFGDQEFAVWYRSPKPVIKSSVATEMGIIDVIPQQLRDIREASGFDFGKFDYTEINGEVLVHDRNKTPAINAQVMDLMPSGKLDDFADQIHTYQVKKNRVELISDFH